MPLRPYNKYRDFQTVQSWITNERTHALWCAGLIPYPLREASFQNVLEQEEKERGGCGYIFTDSHGNPAGFFVFEIDAEKKEGFLKFVVVDGSLRGRGYGVQMLRLLLEYAGAAAGVTRVGLNVFDCNGAAKGCYRKAGFTEVGVTPDVFTFAGESWGRCRMTAGTALLFGK